AHMPVNECRNSKNRMRLSIDGSDFISVEGEKLFAFISTIRRVTEYSFVTQLMIKADITSFSSKIRDFLVKIETEELILKDNGDNFDSNWEEHLIFMKFLSKTNQAIMSRAVYESGDLVKIYKKMMSRKISLTSIDIHVDFTSVRWFLNDIHNIDVIENWMDENGECNPLHFAAFKQTTMVIYCKILDDSSFSILFFDGLFQCEWYRERNEQEVCGLRMEWCENEEEVKKKKENYKIAEMIEMF
ncbi:hypothetical protein PFISCL1PPCAC_19192, partial [Pristionchus fissidentatus]